MTDKHSRISAPAPQPAPARGVRRPPRASGSTRAAADRVARSQSAASAALADLEAALGAQLFDRIGRRLVLNENGRALLAERSVSLVDQAAELQAMFFTRPRRRRCASRPASRSASTCCRSWCCAWKQDNPRGTRAAASSATRTDVIAAVVGFDADVGFIEGRQTHPDLAVRRWLNDEMVIVAAPTHPLAGRHGRRARAGRRGLGAARGRLRHARGHRPLAAPKRLGALDMSSSSAAARPSSACVASGVGIGCMSRYAVADALARGLAGGAEDHGCRRNSRALSIVLHRERRPGRAMQGFIDCKAEADSGSGRTAGRRGREDDAKGAKRQATSFSWHSFASIAKPCSSASGCPAWKLLVNRPVPPRAPPARRRRCAKAASPRAKSARSARARRAPARRIRRRRCR